MPLIIPIEGSYYIRFVRKARTTKNSQLPVYNRQKDLKRRRKTRSSKDLEKEIITTEVCIGKKAGGSPLAFLINASHLDVFLVSFQLCFFVT